MFLTLCKSKIANAKVTQADLYYQGSITIDEDILKASGILPGEKVEVLNLNNGTRVETYTIAGRPGAGEICLNGPAARSGCVGDTLIILCYCLAEEKEARGIKPKVVQLDDHNKIKR